ncbi:MAG: hypothetical protein PPP58_04890 [Natronomonas sp.]
MSSDVDSIEGTAWIIVGVVIVGCLGAAVALPAWPVVGLGPDDPEATDPTIVEPTADGTGLWPYTATAQAPETRTLGINVVIRGDPATVETILREQTPREWHEGEHEEGDATADTHAVDELIEVDPDAESLSEAIEWDDAEGSTRYTMVIVDGERQWLDESYQFHAGTYLGDREHIRAYDDPAGEWTAIQIHEEHWDWFRLRHTVTGVSESQRALERAFLDSPFVDSVVREPFGNDTADGDGWATIVTLSTAGALGVVAVGLPVRTRRIGRTAGATVRNRRSEIVGGLGVFSLYLGVRLLGIAGEVTTGLRPKVVAAPLYVALVVGMPAIAYLVGRRVGASDRWYAFAAVGIGLGAAFGVDFLVVDVSLVPLRVGLHRIAVCLSVGLIALGAAGGGTLSDRDRRSLPLAVGLVGWIAVLFLPLFGYL